MKKIFALIALICGFNLATAQDSIQVRITADYTNANTTTNQITGLKHARIMNMLNNRIINVEYNQWKLGGNSGSNSFWLGTNNNFPLIFRTNNTERGRFSNGGLFGLGTSSPAYLLDVDARAIGGNPLRLQGLQAGTASTDSLLVLSNGVVRRIAPATSLFGSSYWSIAGNTLSGEASIGSSNNFNVLFKQNNQERMRLDGVGVKIGANSVLGSSYTDGNPSLTINQNYGDSNLSELLINSPLKSQIVLENQDVDNNALRIGIESGVPFINSATGEVINQTPTSFTEAYVNNLTADKFVTAISTKKLISSAFGESDLVLRNGNANGSLLSLGTNDNNSVAIETNNTERVRILNSGFVGIGITNPLYRLDIDAGGIGNPLRLQGLQAGATTDSILTSNNGIVRRLSVAQITANDWNFGGNTVTSVQNLGTTSNFALPFITNNVERMRITSSGNVGISTNAPAYKLDIDANTGSTGNPLRLQGLQAGATTDSLLTSSSGIVRRLAISQLGAGNFWQIGGNTEGGVRNLGTSAANDLPLITNNTERMRITTAGNVGIGTTTPAQRLEVNGNIFVNKENATISIDNVSSARMGFAKKSGQVPCIATNNVTPIVFAKFDVANINDINTANFTELMRISNAGQLAIGTTTPANSAILEVASTTQGVLLPRMTTTQINAIVSPAEGLEVWNTTLKAKCVYDGTQWLRLSHSTM